MLLKGTAIVVGLWLLLHYSSQLGSMAAPVLPALILVGVAVALADRHRLLTAHNAIAGLLVAAALYLVAPTVAASGWIILAHFLFSPLGGSLLVLGIVAYGFKTMIGK